jgi:hypothetical protein
MSLSIASIAYRMAGDRTSAGGLLDAAQAITTSESDFPARVSLLQGRALNALLDDLVTVRSATTEGVRLGREAGDLYSLGMLLVDLALVALIDGELDELKPLLSEALGIARRLDDRVAEYCLLDGLGCHAAHAARSGQPQLAARLLGAADAVQASGGAASCRSSLHWWPRPKQSTTAALGEHSFQAEFEAGQGLSREAAIASALGERADAAAPATGDPRSSPRGKREAEVAHAAGQVETRPRGS